MKRVRLVAAMVGITGALFFSACGGGGSDPIAGPTASPSSGDPNSFAPNRFAPDVDAFCRAIVEIDSYVEFAEDEEWMIDAARETLYGEAQRVVPDEIRGPMSVLGDAVRTQATTPEDQPITPEMFAANDRVDEHVLRTCPHSGRVTMTVSDGPWTDLPVSIPGGTVALTVRNDGADLHMVQFLRMRPGSDLTAAEVVALPDEVGWEHYEAGPSTYVPAGTADTSFFRLPPGRYIAADFLLTGTTMLDGGDGPPHHTVGQFGEVQITADA